MITTKNTKSTKVKGEKMLIAVVNHSKQISNSDAAIMTAAIQIQLNLHVAPAWNQKAPTITFYADPKKVPGYAWSVGIFDNPTVLIVSYSALPTCNLSLR